MKKLVLTTVFIGATILSANADSYMSVSDSMNARMFSTDSTRPLMNLERTNYTNRAILQIEEKQRPQQKENNKKEISNNEPKEKTKFKDLFKGFVVEW